MKHFHSQRRALLRLYSCPSLRRFRKKMLGKVLVSIALLLLGGATFFGWIYSHQPPLRHPAISQALSIPIMDTLKTYCHALTVDDISTAFALLDLDTQHTVTVGGFEAQIDHFTFLHRGLRACQIVDPIAIFHAAKANTIITFSNNDGSQYKLALALLKENQQWKILFAPFLCTFSPGIQNLQDAPCCHSVSPQVLFPSLCGDTMRVE